MVAYFVTNKLQADERLNLLLARSLGSRCYVQRYVRVDWIRFIGAQYICASLKTPKHQKCTRMHSI